MKIHGLGQGRTSIVEFEEHPVGTLTFCPCGVAHELNHNQTSVSLERFKQFKFWGLERQLSN